MYMAKGSCHVLLMVTKNAYPVCPQSLDFHKRPLNDAQPLHLCDLMSGKVVLAVNTASKRACTSPYDGLEKIHEHDQKKGLIVAGFPSQVTSNDKRLVHKIEELL